MGLEPTRAVWGTNKEWPLTGIGCSSSKVRYWPKSHVSADLELV